MTKHLNSKRKIFLACFILIIFSGIRSGAQMMPQLAPNFLQLPEKNFNFKFKWLGDSVNATWEPNAYLLLPVKLPNCPRQFYMQFDLGSPSTIFYKSMLQQIESRFPKVQNMQDSGSKLRNFNFKVGTMPVHATELAVMNYRSKNIDWSDEKGIDIIGTIGADFIENRTMVLDYPARQFYNGISMRDKFASRLALTDFMFPRRSVLLPAIIRGKKLMLFYDTGSSAYQLLTDKKTSELMAAPRAIAIYSESRSWDKMRKMTTLATNDSIQIGSNTLPIRFTTFSEGASEAQITQMMKLGIGGMTGNKLFVNSVLILDTKNKKFGVITK